MDRLEVFRAGVREGIKLARFLTTPENITDSEFDREMHLKATRGEYDPQTDAAKYVPEGPTVAPEVVVVMQEGVVIEARAADPKTRFEVYDELKADHKSAIHEARQKLGTIY